MTRVRARHLPVTTKLNLVPMLDMFMFVLIFLIVSFAPRDAKLKPHPSLHLPTASAQMLGQSKAHLELIGDELRLNGKSIAGFKFSSASAESWNTLRSTLGALNLSKQAIILSADKNISFGRIDRLVSKLSSMGFDQVYFLSQQSKEVP